MESTVYDVKSSHGLRMQSIGPRLRSERKRIGLSQQELADKTGVHRQTQVNYERDRRTPPDDYLDAAKNLGIDTTFVMTGLRVDASAQVTQAKEVLLRFLLQALGYKAPDELIADAVRIWTNPTEADVAGGGMEGLSGRLVGDSPTVGLQRDGANQIDADRLVDVLVLIQLEAERRKIVLAPFKAAEAAAALYREVARTGSIRPEDVGTLLSAPD